MDIKTKYQYSYFVYPFIVDSNNYEKYLKKLLKDKRCSIRIFDKARDLELYRGFLPHVNKFMFPTFYMEKDDIQKLKQKSFVPKLNVIKNMSSVTFEYNLGKRVQGKAGSADGIFFEIDKINIICFKIGVCFISIKTRIEHSNCFKDVLNFNYKFRNVYSKFLDLKDYYNINIQNNKFDSMKEISDIIKEIVGGFESEKIDDITSDRLFTYSYVCTDSSEWNEKSEFSDISREFIKFKNVLGYDYANEFNDAKNELENTYSKWKYSIYGFSKLSGVVFTSGIEPFNFTKLPFYYETVYFHIMILAFLHRITLLMLLLNPSDRQLRMFVNSEYFNQITNFEHEKNLWDKWQETFEIKYLYNQVNEECILINKNESDNIFLILFAVIVLLSVVSLIIQITPLKIVSSIITMLIGMISIIIILLKKYRK